MEKNNIFLQESRGQIKMLWSNMFSFNTHTDMFTVQILVKIGTILNLVEDDFKKKADYTAWVRRNFQHKCSRYFQQAKQLANIGSVAHDFAALGKNRLL